MLKNFNVLMEKTDGDGKQSGGGNSSEGGNTSDVQKELNALKAANADLSAKYEKLLGKKKTNDEEDQNQDDGKDLNEKARKQRAEDDKNKNDHKALEAALRFSLKSEEFLKTNASLLPKDISDIFKAADKEKYDSAIEKDAALKAGIIQSFFKVQSNMDLLTPGIKGQLEDYLKLTNTGKQERAQQIYENIFEPSFETLKRVKKAEALNSGYEAGDGADEAYKQKLMKLSKNHYMGEKSNGS